jgi:hypothetical protein
MVRQLDGGEATALQRRGNSSDSDEVPAAQQHWGREEEVRRDPRHEEAARRCESASRPLVDFGVLNDNLIK